MHQYVLSLFVLGEAKLSTQPRRSSKRKKGFVKSSESKEEKSAVSTTVLPYKHRCIICLKHIIIEYKKGQLDTAGTHAGDLSITSSLFIDWNYA